MSKSKNEQEQIIRLERLSEEILELKRQTIPRRPIVIEFCGSPKAGKSSCINALNLFLKRNKYKTKVLVERASVCPVKDKYDPFFNIWTASSAIAELAEILSNNPKDYDLVILDRGIFDALCWFTWLLERNAIDQDNYDSLVGFLTMKKWRAAIDLVYVFTVSPKISLEREYAYLLTEKRGSIMRPKILASYNQAIATTIGQFGDKYRRVQNFDTGNVTIQAGNYEVTDNVLNILLSSVVERIGYVTQKQLTSISSEVFRYSEYPKMDKLTLNFERRDMVENNDNMVQPIPIAVITNIERSKILVAKKNKSAGSQTNSKSPERNKILVYFGGHIREEDSIDTNQLLKTAKYALQRELKEELGIDYTPPESDSDPLCIWDKRNARSGQHLAMCFLIEVDFDTLKVKLDKNEFITSGNTKSGSVMDVKDLFKIYSKSEEWSRAILREIFDYKSLSQRDLFES